MISGKINLDLYAEYDKELRDSNGRCADGADRDIDVCAPIRWTDVRSSDGRLYYQRYDGGLGKGL